MIAANLLVGLMPTGALTAASAALFPPSKLEDGLAIGLVAGFVLSAIPCGIAVALAKKTGTFGPTLKLCVPPSVLGLLFALAGLVSWGAGVSRPVSVMLAAFGAAMLFDGVLHIVTVRAVLAKLKRPTKID
jgi:hypothetical protein